MRLEALRDDPVMVIFVKGGEEGRIGVLLVECAAWVGVGLAGLEERWLVSATGRGSSGGAEVGGGGVFWSLV